MKTDETLTIPAPKPSSSIVVPVCGRFTFDAGEIAIVFDDGSPRQPFKEFLAYLQAAKAL